MPLTILHMGLMAPFIRHKGYYAALVSFALINLWIDLAAILALFRGTPFPPHTEASHTLPVALLMGLVLASPGALPWVRSTGWVAGALFGAVSHVLLDALVHADMNLLGTGKDGEIYNPLYLGLMTHISVLLIIPTIYVIARFVSDALDALRRVVEVHRQNFERHNSAKR